MSTNTMIPWNGVHYKDTHSQWLSAILVFLVLACVISFITKLGLKTNHLIAFLVGSVDQWQHVMMMVFFPKNIIIQVVKMVLILVKMTADQSLSTEFAKHDNQSTTSKSETIYFSFLLMLIQILIEN